MMDNSEKKAQHSQERVKSAEKRSSRSFKSFVSTVAATERMKRSSGSGRHNQQSGQKREGRSHSKDDRGSAEHQGENSTSQIYFTGRTFSLNVSKSRDMLMIFWRGRY